MKNKNCLPFLSEIEESASTGSVGNATRGHIGHCADCADAFSEYSRLRELIAGLGSVSAPPDFDLRLRARIAQAKTVKPATLAWIWKPMGAPALGVVSATVLVLAGAWAMNSGAIRLPGSNRAIFSASQLNGDTNSLERIAFTLPTRVIEVATTPEGETTLRHQSARSDGREITSSDVSTPNTLSVHPVGEVVVPAGFSGANGADANEFEIPVRASNGKILVDERGRMRTVSLPNVSFGAQDMMVPATMRSLPPAPQRIW